MIEPRKVIAMIGMPRSKKQKTVHAGPVLALTAMVLAVSLGFGTPQTVAGAQTATGVQEDTRRAYERMSYAYALGGRAWSTEGEEVQVPQDIRIMQRIVHTALGEVEAPELPDALKETRESSELPGAYIYEPGDTEAVIVLGELGGRAYSIGGRDVTGFYMQGYGYLFTVKWQVTSRSYRFRSWARSAERAVELGALAEEARRTAGTREEETEARAAVEAERALEQERDRLEAQQAAWEEWAAQYRDRLAESLREVVALYGSTLKRATPEEAITFIADFGGGEDETVTVSTRRGQLTGASRDENLAAVRVTKGETGVSNTLRTELKIMSEIIDSSLEVEGAGENWAFGGDFGVARYYGEDSSYQYVPDYGVLFRKGARLNIATELIRRANRERRSAGVNVDVETLREQIEEGAEEQREAYVQHLEGLKVQTAAILATYGPTLTELNDDDWVGVFYNVGSAAGLLEGGISNFLVQARMADVRQAGAQADGATWLLDRLVTNEKQD